MTGWTIVVAWSAGDGAVDGAVQDWVTESPGSATFDLVAVTGDTETVGVEGRVQGDL